MAENRKLAAILAADIVGYSRLAGADEDRTLARLRALRSDLIDPTISVHHGRVVKRTGDGALIEFRSVVDAVRCAIEVQNGMVERNAGLPPDRRIEFRIGIHVGDVVEESDGDLMGDGVNIAARLETVASPAGIVLSGVAYEQVRDKISEEFVDLGEQSLKNIARPVRAYAIARSQSTVVRHDVQSRAQEPPRLSLVVLPFANLSGNPADDYFADGITEDITTDLSRIPESFVIARNTAFTYKGKAVDAKQVGRELGIRYVLEGSVRRAGSRVRANVQLIDADSGAHLWAERFDCDRTDLMEVQDEVTGRIAGALGTQLIEVESRRSLRERPTNPDALDLTMRGWSALHHIPSSEVLTEAKSRFEQALALDAHAVDALIGLGYCLLRRAQSGFDQRRNEDVATAADLIERALTLDPQRARAHWVRGMVLRNQGKPEQSVAAFEEAIALDRNFAPAYGSLGDVVSILDRPEDTIHFNERAIRLSPRDPQLANWLFDIAQAHLMLEHNREAVTWAPRAHTANPNFPWAALCLAVAYAFTGETTAAQAALAEFHRIKPEIKSFNDLRAAVPLLDLPHARRGATRYAHGMQLLGMPG